MWRQVRGVSHLSTKHTLKRLYCFLNIYSASQRCFWNYLVEEGLSVTAEKSQTEKYIYNHPGGRPMDPPT